DEAYIEFGGGSGAAEAVGRGNVLVTRTFSKAWGLAGLRVGYGIGAPRLVEEVEKARGPFKVNAVAEAAAAAAVRGDRVWLDDVVAQTRAGRARLTAGLDALGYEALPSAANFVSARVPDAAAVTAALDASGIGVRGFSRLPVLGDVIRITVGPDAEIDALLAAVRTIPAGVVR
ncbi:MAG: aminotransferase class I/II-fold pyridoxal phosphate-dependent enzyme, partial [Gemmatimonadales bacterium]